MTELLLLACVATERSGGDLAAAAAATGEDPRTAEGQDIGGADDGGDTGDPGAAERACPWPEDLYE